MTLQRLGDLSGVSASTIHKMENLQTVPTISVLLKVAHGLNRRPSELLAEVEVGRKVSVIRSKEKPSLKVVPGGETYQLEAGDSVHFDSSLPHRWVAAEGRPAQAIALAVLPERLQGDLIERVASMAGVVVVTPAGEGNDAGES